MRQIFTYHIYYKLSVTFIFTLYHRLLSRFLSFSLATSLSIFVASDKFASQVFVLVSVDVWLLCVCDSFRLSHGGFLLSVSLCNISLIFVERFCVWECVSFHYPFIASRGVNDCHWRGNSEKFVHYCELYVLIQPGKKAYFYLMVEIALRYIKFIMMQFYC